MSDPIWLTPGDSCALAPNVFPFGPARIWVCNSLPPAGWPWHTTDITPAQIGPDFTAYQFSAVELAARYAHGALYGADRLAFGMEYWNAPPLVPGVDQYIWQLLPDRIGNVTIDVIRATIHAKLGTVEESCNVLHYISEPEVAITDAMLATIGAKVVTQWEAFLATGAGVGTAVSAYCSSLATWDEVRTAHVQIVGTSVKWAAGTNTTFTPFDAATAGSGDPLPSQIACAVSLDTGVRAGVKGRSGRGRMYLGPLAKNAIAATSLFQAGFNQQIADAFKATMLDGMAATPNPFKLVVLSPASNARYLVTDVRVGMVPDTQRRRRKSFPEVYVTAV